MFEVLSQYWWVFVLRGIFAVLFMILAVFWPGITVAALILLFSSYVLIDGILLILKAIGNWNAREDRLLLLIEGFLGIGIGMLTFIVSSITMLVLFFYIVAWSLSTGVIKIVAAIRLRKEMASEWWLLMSGFASVLFAFLLMSFFNVGTVALAYVIVVYAILYGIILVIMGFKLLKVRKKSQPVRM
jgi:uncharacterized membrane protein HdeD (DUF308 family)